MALDAREGGPKDKKDRVTWDRSWCRAAWDAFVDDGKAGATVSAQTALGIVLTGERRAILESVAT